MQTAKTELSNLSIKDLFFKYVRFLPLFVICVAVSLFGAYLYLRYATLVYRASGTMVIRDERSSSGSNDKLEELLTSSDGKKNIQNEIEVLQSRPLMERVVRSLDLNFTYIAIGNIKELNVYKACPFKVQVYKIHKPDVPFTLNLDFEGEAFRVNKQGRLIPLGTGFENEYGVFKLVRNSPAPFSNSYKVEWRSTPDQANNLRSALLVTPKPNTGILNLTMEGTNAEMIADVINQLMREYQLSTVEEKNETTSKTLEFIDVRLDSLEKEINSITARKVVFSKSADFIDAQIQSSDYFTRLQEADKETNRQRILLNNTQMIEDYLRDKKYAFTPVPSSLSVEDQTLATLISAYNVAQLERKELVDDKVPQGNVIVQQKVQQIEELRQRIIENLRNIKTATHSAMRNFQSQAGGLQAEIKALPEKQQKMLEIDRELQGKLVVYNSLLEKREESAIARASTISNIKVLQDATANNIPVKPNRRNAKMLAIVIGLLLPALFIFILELLNDKVTTRHDIERLTRASILGEVGHAYGKDTLIVTHNNRSVVAEQFRILRSNLQYVLNNIHKPVILVTSSFSGEGKSFISTNIGAVMALAGKRTVILEFDIRKPKIISGLNLPKKAGLTNYLLGKMQVEEVFVPVPGYDNLLVLPCGPVPPNPAELLLDPKLNELFDYLKANFDVVIMDTAPVGMVSDAMTLSKFADATLYIVRQGHTFKKQVGMIDEFYQQGKLPKISIVLNDVKIRTGYGYYGYGRYGYGYGYGSGYFEDDTPPPGFFSRWFGWLDIKKWKKKQKKRKHKHTEV